MAEALAQNRELVANDRERPADAEALGASWSLPEFSFYTGRNVPNYGLTLRMSLLMSTVTEIRLPVLSSNIASLSVCVNLSAEPNTVTMGVPVPLFMSMIHCVFPFMM